MDHTPATTDDARRSSPLRDLSPRQRAGLAVASLIVVVGLSWTVWSRTNGDLVPLPTNEPLTAATVRELQSTFRAAGLTDSHRSGDQILVPASRLNDYAAILPSQQANTDHWADEWERQNERLTPFSSHRDRETNREIARARLITGMLQQLPDVQQADLVWDEEEQPGWRAAPRARATVYLQPKPGRVLTLDVIRSVRLAVAGSKKNLDSADVTVMDLARQITYEGPFPATLGDDLLPSLRSLAELYRREIQEHIPELTHADVAVSVDLPRFFAFVGEHADEAERQLSAAAPTLLRVAIEMPVDSTVAASSQSSLVERIVTLTGIGEVTEDRDERIAIAFAAKSPESAVQPSWSLAGFAEGRWSDTFDRRWLPASVGGVLLIGTSLLLFRRSRRRERSTQRSFPTLHQVNQSAESFDDSSSLLAFDDLARLDATALHAMYSHATPRRWAVALRGSASEVREHLAAALEPSDASDLRHQCQALGPVTVGDIESSRQRILESARESSHHAPRDEAHARPAARAS